MSDLQGAARELCRRAYELAKRVELRHEGNGFYQHEYEIGEVSFVVCGHFDYETGKPIETELFVDTGTYTSDEVLMVEFEEQCYTGTEFINIKTNGAAIPEILELARKHMVLDDLADV